MALNDPFIEVDIETLDTGTNAAILQIGAVYVDKEGFKDTFEAFIKPDLTRHAASAETILFHLDLNNGVLKKALDEGFPAPAVMQHFAAFLLRHSDAKSIWCRGTDFDLPILRNHAEFLDSNCLLFQYWRSRDERTLIEVADYLQPGFSREIPKPTNAHSALYDAVYQADVHIAAVRVIDEAKRR